MMYRTITSSAEPRIEDISFSQVSVGDTVTLTNINPLWSLPKWHIIEAIDEDAIQTNGAWYRENDGWSIRIAITTKTVEVKEPNPQKWVRVDISSLYIHHISVRSVSDANTMIRYEDVKFNKSTYRAMQALSNYIEWEPFARAAYKIGIENINTIVEPFHKIGLKEISKIKFDRVIEEGVQLEKSISKALGECSDEVLFSNNQQIPLDDKKRLWLLALAGYRSAKNTLMNYDDLMLVIDNLGEEQYLKYALKHTPLEVMKNLATQIRDNDIDAQLVLNLDRGAFQA